MELVYDPSSDPVVEQNDFEQRDWTSSEFGTAQRKEEIPSNMPELRGQGFSMCVKVDADHASDTVMRCSRTGFLVYLNVCQYTGGARSKILWSPCPLDQNSEQ